MDIAHSPAAQDDSPESDHFPLPPELTGKKIMVLSESLGPINGVTRATQSLLEYLVERKAQVVAVAPEFEKEEKSLLKDRLPIIRLKGAKLYYNPDLRLVYPFRMKKIFERTFKPDIVYLASPATIGLQVWWQLRNAGIPVVANFQTDLASYSRRMLPILLNNSAAWLIDRVTSLLKQDCFKFILVPSGSARAYLSSLGVKEERMRLVGRGVDGTVFNPAFRSEELRHTLAPNGEVLLLCVSRVSLEKGFDFLADAYALMVKLAKERGLKTPFRLVVTGGNTNQGIENAIKSYFEKQSLDVVFTGPRTGNPLSEVYASADIFVFPSLTETFGQVIQEAMSSGLPVVARREGGPADIVEEGETGFLINPSDATDFAEKTLRLVEDAGLRREMSEKALRFACSRSWDAINQQIARIMVEAL